jgi:hypothetical protein
MQAKQKGMAMSPLPSLVQFIDYGNLLFVAILAGGRPFLHVGMTAFAGFVCEVLAEAFNFSGCFFVTFLAVFQHLLVLLVGKLDASFELDNITAESSSGQRSKGNQGNGNFFHFQQPPS